MPTPPPQHLSRTTKRLYYGLGFVLPSLLLVLGSVYAAHLSYQHHHRYFGLDFDDCRHIVKYGIAPYSDKIVLMTILLYPANRLWQTATFIFPTARYRRLHWKTLVWLFGFPVLCIYYWPAHKKSSCSRTSTRAGTYRFYYPCRIGKIPLFR